MTRTNSGLISRLAQHDIKKVAIIDDVYDALTKEYVANDVLNEFWDAIEEDAATLKALEDMFPGENFESSDDLSDEVLQGLWESRDKGNALSAFCMKQDIFKNRLQDIKHLDSLCEHMRSLGLDPQPYGADQEIPKEQIKIVFIDYYLGGNNKAINIIREFCQHGEEGAEKPFFVLMSYKGRSKTEIDFLCEESKLLKGLFDFVTKEDLSIKQKLLIKLETWLMGWSTRHIIQRFVDNVAQSLPAVNELFMKKIRGLSFEDYAYIQFLSLEKEEYPLGRYILWLYSSMFTSLAFEENDGVKAVTKEIDRLHYDQFLPTQTTSPLQLAEFYRIALSEPINQTNYSESELPTLSFGDLLINANKFSVFLVANASCDLIRQKDPDYSIILIPGKFIHLSQPYTYESTCCTELFEFQGQPYRIVWDHKQVLTRSHRKIKELLTKGVYSHDQRLRLPYALQIQQAFTTHMSRIGLPVQPPISECVSVELWWVNKDGECQQLSDPFPEGAIIINLRNSVECVLTVSFLLYFWSEIKRVSSKLTDEFSNIKINHTRLNKYVEEHELLLPMLKPWELKEKKAIINNFLTIYVNGSFEQIDKKKTPFCLNIKRPVLSKDQNGDIANVEGETNAEGT